MESGCSHLHYVCVTYANMLLLTRGFSLRLSGYSPFLGDDQADTYANISAGEYDLDDEYFGDVSDEAKDFISKLLILNPK